MFYPIIYSLPKYHLIYFIDIQRLSISSTPVINWSFGWKNPRDLHEKLQLTKLFNPIIPSWPFQHDYRSIINSFSRSSQFKKTLSLVVNWVKNETITYADVSWICFDSIQFSQRTGTAIKRTHRDRVVYLLRSSNRQSNNTAMRGQ